MCAKVWIRNPSGRYADCWILFRTAGFPAREDKTADFKGIAFFGLLAVLPLEKAQAQSG
jgi:hypothetical protein